MRVCVETSSFQGRFAGIAYYAWFLLSALCESREEIDIWGFNGLNFQPINRAYLDHVLSGNEAQREQAVLDRSRIYAIGRQIPLARQIYRRVKAARFTRQIESVDLFHAVNYIPPTLSFRRTLPLIHDLSHERFSETHPAERVYWLRKGLKRLNSYPLLQTVSRFSANEISDFYGIDKSRIVVTYPGVNPIFSPQPQPHDAVTLSELDLKADSFFLAIGTLEPRKNLKTVLNAFGILPKSVRLEHPLVLVGQPGWGDVGLSQFSTLLEEGSVRVLGYQSAERLAALCRCSRTILFPSVYEGFGIPTVEALASGKRPVLSDIPIMREVAGATADFVEPLSVEGWAEALKEVIDDSRREDTTYQPDCIAQAAKFSWSINARQTIDLYKAAGEHFNY